MTTNLANMLIDIIADPDAPDQIRKTARRELVAAATESRVERMYERDYRPWRWRDHPYGTWASSSLSAKYEKDGACQAFLAAAGVAEFHDSLSASKATSEAAAVIGQLGGWKGGPARAQALSPERRSEIASMGAKARWGKKDD